MAKLLSGTRVYGTATIDSILFINSTATSLSTQTGAMQVLGGVGIGGNLYVGGNLIAASINITATNYAKNIQGGTTGSILYQMASSSTGFITVGGTGTFLISNGTTATFSSSLTNLVLSGTTQSTSTNTGALQVVGGAGIGGNLYVGSTGTFTGSLLVLSTLTSLSTTTGAVVIAGGLGVGDSVYVGNRIGFVTSASVSAFYQIYNPLTNTIDMIFG